MLGKSRSALTANQLAALQYIQDFFKNQTDIDTDIQLNDSLFLRYLRARDFDQEKALDQIKKTISWRKEFGLKDIDSWIDIIKEENKTGKIYCRGYDKEGHIILYMKPSKENTNNHDGNLKHLVYNLEKSIKAMEAKYPHVEKITLICDYDGFSLLNAPPFKTSMATLSILQNHYPERLFRAYAVRPPWVFSTFYAAISPFVDPVTRNKIVMVTSNLDNIRSTLLTIIDEDVLESSLGGKDDRPFESELYLSSQMAEDYLTSLNNRDGPLTKLDTEQPLIPSSEEVNASQDLADTK
jgi:hypothetical protein